MRLPPAESLHAARVMFGSTVFHGNQEVQLLSQIFLCDSKDVSPGSPGGSMGHVLETFAQSGSSLKSPVFSQRTGLVSKQLSAPIQTGCTFQSHLPFIYSVSHLFLYAILAILVNFILDKEFYCHKLGFCKMLF